MRTVEWSGTLTALSSIAHGGKDMGTTHGFRRETLILPSGKRLAGVPVVSGGVVRGSMRRLAAAMMQQAVVGDGRLPFHVVHALRTGGSLRETRASEEVLTSERQAVIRDALPMLACFGFSTNGRIVSGRLQVDKPLPVAQETQYLAEAYSADLEGFEPPSVWELVQRESYSRFPDVNDSAAQPYIEEDLTTERSIPKGAGAMLWVQETLPAGTRLFHSLTLEEATPPEVSFMDELVQRWSQRGRVGGQVARGMGKVRFDHTRTCMDVLGSPADEEQGSTWREHVAQNHDVIQEVFGWL